jgi:integron integrase
MRRRGYSIRTEQAYEQWVDRFLAFCDHANPSQVGSAEVLAFLQHLAVTRQVAANTQNQARSALAFFYTQVLRQPLDTFDGLVPAKRPQRLPVVLTRAEVATLLAAMHGVHGLMAALMYGTGMRVMECMRLRVQDIDFAYCQITVRDGKGQKDRVVPLPQRPVETLQHHLATVQRLHQDDLQAGYGAVFLPHALARKYPQAPKAWGWQYVFPSARLSVDPRSGVIRRHHLHENGVQKAVQHAARAVALTKRVTPHTLRDASTYCYTSLRGIDFKRLALRGPATLSPAGPPTHSWAALRAMRRVSNLATRLSMTWPSWVSAMVPSIV